MLWGSPGEFFSQMQIVPRAPELEAGTGIVLFPEPLLITESGMMDLMIGQLDAGGEFMVNSGLLTGANAFFLKGGRTAVTNAAPEKPHRCARRQG